MTTTPSLRERVARAIEKAHWSDPDSWIPEADAALAVVREWMVSEDNIESIGHLVQKHAREVGDDTPIDYGDAEGLSRVALQAAAKKMGE